MTLKARLALLLAPDGFRGSDGVLGGDLVDAATPFAARDKVQHAAGGALLQLLITRWWPSSPIGWVWLVLVIAALWESLELVRWLAWRRRGMIDPWPMAADRASWRDIVATLAGAAAAWAAL